MLKSDEDEKNQQKLSGEDQESLEPASSEQGIESVQDEPAEDAEPKQTTEIEDSPPEMTEDKKEEIEADESIPDWLRPEFSSEDENDELSINEVDLLNNAIAEGGKPPATEDEDFAREVEPPVSAESPTTNESDELGWLEQIASGEGTSLEEAPTMSWDDESGADSAVAAEDMTWLEEMDTEESTPVIGDLEEDQSGLDESEDQAIAQPQVDTILPDSDPAGDVPDDPDEVMAWLENLAARQGADPEELPTYSPEPTESQPMQTGEIPEDPDEAMAWLEQLAAHEESSIDNSTLLVDLEPADELDELMADAAVTESFDEKSDDPSEVEIPADLDEALIWLEEIVEIPPEKEDHKLPAVDPEEELMATAASVPETDADFVDEIEEEDVEQAMEWLEQLAARQGAAPEELASDIEVDSEVQAPDWVEAQQEEFKPEELVDLAISSAKEIGTEEETDLAISDYESLLETEEPIGAEIEEILPLDEDVIESLSEMTPEIAAERVADEDMDWLETLGNVDAEGWLESEADATEVPVDTQISQIDTGILISKELLVDSEGQENIVEDEDNIQETEPLDEELLYAAHSAVNAGDYSQAVEEYTILLEKEVDLNQLIRDLESSSEAFAKEPLTQRLLGDVYAKNGQTQKALKVYRKALDNL